MYFNVLLLVQNNSWHLLQIEFVYSLSQIRMHTKCIAWNLCELYGLVIESDAEFRKVDINESTQNETHRTLHCSLQHCQQRMI